MMTLASPSWCMPSILWAWSRFQLMLDQLQPAFLIATHWRCTRRMRGQVAHVDDADAPSVVSTPARVAVLKPGAGVAVVLPDAEQELLVADQAEDAHVARQAVDLRQHAAGRAGSAMLMAYSGSICARGDGVGHLALDDRRRCRARSRSACRRSSDPTRCGLRAVGDVPGLEGVLGVRSRRAVAELHSWRAKMPKKVPRRWPRRRAVGHLELVVERAVGLEVGVAAGCRPSGSLMSMIDTTACWLRCRSPAARRPPGRCREAWTYQFSTTISALDGGRDGDAGEAAVEVTVPVLVVDVDAAALEDLAARPTCFGFAGRRR